MNEQEAAFWIMIGAVVLVITFMIVGSILRL